MNKSILILTFFTLSFFLQNCNKNDEEIPQWLQDKIEELEVLTDNPDYQYLEICQWERYTYKKDYYFMFYNPILSSLPETYNYEGVSLDDLNISYEDFYEEKCCKKVIWRGSGV